MTFKTRLKEWRTFLLFGSELSRLLIYILFFFFIFDILSFIGYGGFWVIPLIVFICRGILLYGIFTTAVFLLEKIILREKR